MRKKREFIEGAYYHVTSRANDKASVFESRIALKLMLMVLDEAKEKFGFDLANFCVMPTHIHLLIRPQDGTNLSRIMQWIKTQSAKRLNFFHDTKNHIWGDRYFSRAIKDQQEFETVMEYIDQNPVKAGLATTPADWQGSMQGD